MELAALCRSHMNFTPTEVPEWRVGVPSTSQMVQDMAVWTAKFSRSPTAVAFADYNHWSDAVARFVVSSNTADEAGEGMESVERSKEVLGRGDGTGDAEWEVIRLGMALRALKAHYDLRLGCSGQREWEALAVTPDMVLELHRTLGGDQGARMRTGDVAGDPEGAYPDHGLVPGLLQALCDLYNGMVRLVAEETGCGRRSESGDVLLDLYKVAGLTYVHFVTVCPFPSANGRMASLLVAFVLWALTPFPVTPFCDGGERSKLVLRRAVQACRASVCPHTFLGLLPPCDFTALLIEAGWESWQDFIRKFERSVAIGRGAAGDYVALDTSEQKQEGAAVSTDERMDDLIWHLGTSLSL